MELYIGNQSAFFTPDPEEPFAFAQAQGFDAFEWFDDKKVYENGTVGGWTPADATAQRRAELRLLSERGAFRFSVHAPWRANPLKPGGLEAIYESLEFARDIGAKLLNYHLYPEEGPQRFFDASRPAFERAAEYGLQISLENTPETSPEDFNAVFALIHHSPYRDRVGLCLDIGHANCCAATRNDFIRFIDTLSPQVPIIHCHVHENWGDRDAHLTLFTGPAKDHPGGVFAFLDRLRKRNFNGILVLEQFPEPRSLLTQAEARLRELSGCPRHKSSGTAPLPPAAAQPTRTLADNVSRNPETAPVRAVEEASAGLPVLTPSEDHESEFDSTAVSTPFGAALVEASREHVSWRRRLYWVLEQLLSESFVASEENLACIAVYLRFIGTGELPCREDGGHYRPNHHARAAADIEHALLALQTPDNAWLLRRILPWLPAYGEEFQRHEPLTRIRDIAHRNDIPREMKLRIKHDLQNKLHRSAGPEDLQTARDLLQEITAPGASFHPAFVSEFKIFFTELQEFFNAPGLQARLLRLKNTCPPLEPKADHFLAALRNGSPAEKLEAAFFLRSVIAAFLEDSADKPSDFSSTTTDLPENQDEDTVAIKQWLADAGTSALSPALRQQLRACDIELEDVAFTALGEWANRLEHETEISFEWFRATMFALSHLLASETEPEECDALLPEFARWLVSFDLHDRYQALRLKACLERARRICENYSRKVSGVFTPAVLELGAAFHLDPQQLEVFVQADIRANVVFQLSRLLSSALQRIRLAQHLPPWDVIVPGEATGELHAAATLEEAAGPDDRPVVAALEDASGDEEIPPQIKAILVAHPLPHLSHLAVRARQAGVCFAAADAPEVFPSLQALHDQRVRVSYHGDQVILAKSGSVPQEASPQKPATPVPVVHAAAADLDAAEPLLEIAQATPATCGAKAAGAHGLIGLALASNGLFSAPRALAVPYGVLHQELRNSFSHAEYQTLMQTLNDQSPDEFDRSLRRLRQIVSALPVADEITSGIADYFGADTRIAVRSSSNAEDLAGLAGAGLYDSIVGVRASEATGAIATVWASLWTRRAAQSRRQYQIPQEAAQMAVLIQEMVEPEYSFVLHTADPQTGERGKAGIEIAAGLGETLVSADQPGQPWRLSVREGIPPELHSCSSFSFQRQPSDEEGVSNLRLDYTKIRLACEPELLTQLGHRLGQTGRFLEAQLGCPQDVEGVVTGDRIFVVQTRPQAGLSGNR